MKVEAIIKANDNYRMGEDVEIDVMLNNLGHTVCKTLYPKLDKDSVALSKDVFQITIHENQIQYEGLTVLQRLNVVEIMPGEHINFSISLAKEYLMNQIGTYNVKYKGVCYQENGSEVDILSQDQAIILVGSEQDAPTRVRSIDYKMQRYDSEHMHVSYKIKGVVHINASPDQEKDTNAAHENALKALALIQGTQSDLYYWFFGGYTYLSTNDKNYKTMFCSKHAAKRDVLLDKYDKIYDYLNGGIGSKIEYVFQNDDCYKKGKGGHFILDVNGDKIAITGLYGFVIPTNHDKKIYLCDQYNQSIVIPTKATQFDTKMGVIIHEASHKAVNSEDHFYSFGACRKHAESCNDQNIENADCLQMYAELNYYDNLLKIDL